MSRDTPVDAAETLERIVQLDRAVAALRAHVDAFDEAVATAALALFTVCEMGDIPEDVQRRVEAALHQLSSVRTPPHGR